MNKTLWFFGALVFAGGLIGGAVTSVVFCHSRAAVAAPAVTAAPPPMPSSMASNETPAPQRIVSASEFVVLDASGKARAKIDVNDNGQAGFAMYDRDHHARAEIVLDDQGAPSVRLYDTSSKLRLSLGVSNDGIPTVRLMDSGSHSRELLGVDGEGEPALDFYAQDGTVLRELP